MRSSRIGHSLFDGLCDGVCLSLCALCRLNVFAYYVSCRMIIFYCQHCGKTSSTTWTRTGPQRQHGQRNPSRSARHSWQRSLLRVYRTLRLRSARVSTSIVNHLNSLRKTFPNCFHCFSVAQRGRRRTVAQLRRLRAGVGQRRTAGRLPRCRTAGRPTRSGAREFRATSDRCE